MMGHDFYEVDQELHIHGLVVINLNIFAADMKNKVNYHVKSAEIIAK